MQKDRLPARRATPWYILCAPPFDRRPLVLWDSVCPSKHLLYSWASLAWAGCGSNRRISSGQSLCSCRAVVQAVTFAKDSTPAGLYATLYTFEKGFHHQPDTDWVNSSSFLHASLTLIPSEEKQQYQLPRLDRTFDLVIPQDQRTSLAKPRKQRTLSPPSHPWIHNDLCPCHVRALSG